MRSSSVLDSTHAVSACFHELPVDAAESHANSPHRLRERQARAKNAAAEQTKREAEAAGKKREAELKAAAEEAFRKGRDAGEKEAAAKIKPLANALQQAHDELEKQRGELIEQAEAHAVELAVRLAETAVNAQLACTSSVLHAALKEAVTRTAPEKILRVRVNPQDLEAAAELGVQLGRDNVEILPSDHIGRGGCRLETKLGDIASTVESRWQAAEELIRAAMLEKDAADDSPQRHREHNAT